jgi:hypothetical protein
MCKFEEMFTCGKTVKGAAAVEKITRIIGELLPMQREFPIAFAHPPRRAPSA